MIYKTSDRTFDSEIMSSQTPVLVVFWAPWCEHSQSLMPEVNEISAKFYGKLKVLEVNADENIQTAQICHIEGLPSLLLLDKGKELELILGYQDTTFLANWLNWHLDPKNRSATEVPEKKMKELPKGTAMLSGQISIEKNQILEDRFGVSIEGLFIDISNADDDGEIPVSLKGEISVVDPNKLQEVFQIQFVLKNNQGQVIGVLDLLIDEGFTGYQAFDETLYCKDTPSLVRISATGL